MEHAEQLRNGLIYMNKLKTFSGYRDSEGLLRSDPFEGVVAIFQPDKVKLEFQGRQIDTKDISGPILMHDNALMEKYAFCMYSINSKNWQQIREDEVEDFQKDMKVHEQVYGLGSYAVLFINSQEFKQRLESALHTKGYDYRLGFVEYYDELKVTGFLEQAKWGFHKRADFRILNEYRLLIDTPISSLDDLFLLDVGSLRDISIVVPSSDINGSLKIQP
jgi:hypothetical protein